MDEARCLFVLSLLMDGRAVEPEVEAAARAFAASHAACAAALADWEAAREALAATPARRASPGFTTRVLSAAAEAGVGPRRAGAAAGDTLRFARRLALAAGLALAVTIGWDLLHPSTLRADSAVQRHRHAVDHFRSNPYAADDIDAGLRGRLHDEEFGARGGETR